MDGNTQTRPLTNDASDLAPDCHREDVTLPEDGPGCRAMVPYRAMSSLKCRPLATSAGKSLSLLALPPSSCDFNSNDPRSAPLGVVKPLDMPVEVFPTIFQVRNGLSGGITARSQIIERV